MKQIVAMVMTVGLLLALLCGCEMRATEEKAQENARENTSSVTEQVVEGAPKSLLMTIAENETGCTAFEYRYPEQAYCFYAYDERGNFYRVVWSDFDGLTEKGRVAVECGTIKKLTYTEYPNGGYTPAYEIDATHVTVQNYLSVDENGDYVLTLPESGQTLRVREEYERFLPFVSDDAVRAAEKAITEQTSRYSDNSGLYLQVTEDYLCLTAEVIHYLDEPDENVGCFDHEHLFFSERISSIAVKEQPENVCELCGEEIEISYLFAQTLSEDEAWTADISKCGQGIISERERKELMRIYNDRQRWTDDSFVDREAFRFDGFVHFAADGKCGRMYFGFEDNVLYYDGYFTSIWQE